MYLSTKGLLHLDDRWRMEDGMLCRSNTDCMWMDKMLECDRYRFGWDVSSGRDDDHEDNFIKEIEIHFPSLLLSSPK